MSKSNRRRCTALFPAVTLLACCCSAAWAQDDSSKAKNEPSKKTLSTVSVKGALQPYRDLTVTGATKTEAPIKDLPQNITVLGSDLLKDAGVSQLADALDMGSGISRQSNFGGMWDSYSMRGFSGDPNFGSDYMVNGFNASRGYNGMRDAANTATVEILKGPSSALYGRGEPGGTVNINTKKPLFKQQNTLELSAGSFDTFRTAIDTTGPLGKNVAYRLNAAYEDGNSFRDTVSHKNYLVSPSFLWMISPDTTLSYELEAVRQKAPFDRGIVAVNGRLGVVPVSRFYGEPNDGDTTIKSLGHQVFLQHFFNDDWSIQTGVSYRDSSLKGQGTEVRPYGALVNGTTLRRRLQVRDYQATDLTARFEVLGKVHTGAVEHNLLFGVDGYRFWDDRRQQQAAPAGTIYGISLFDPVYGGPKPTPRPSIMTNERQRAAGLYAQDQIDLSEQWKALVGVRVDQYSQTVNDILHGQTVHQSHRATSPRAGLVYEPTEHVSLYATTSRSFRPNSGVSRSFQPFAPERGKSYEVGAKMDFLDGRLSSTLALFKITKKNVLTPDPVDPNNFNIAAGEMQSKGVEWDIAGELTPGLRVSAAYAYTDAHITKDNSSLIGVSLVGRQNADVPKHSANLFLVKQFQLGGKAASLGGGVNYVGRREGSVAPFSNADLFQLPSYTTFKLVSSYNATKRLQFAFDVENLFNRKYYASSYSAYWVFPGTERRYTLTARYSF
ncbi:TonB-dependent siderophore receptor [Frateuria defendens]|uniref:TonB-dependent siderophore receptor n=1 Tax=Frateuria defendens TaxID=2219559 RepID=UPI00066FD367|nr:TonB-dependent siderophore receptor [Frateuria defendens]